MSAIICGQEPVTKNTYTACQGNGLQWQLLSLCVPWTIGWSSSLHVVRPVASLSVRILVTLFMVDSQSKLSP